ncbi:MAG: alcohol dehydrogenase catalytic domain-containing protein [Vicinamibacterales bacterium]
MKAISFAAPIPTYLATQAAGRLSDSWFVGPHACTRYTDVATPELPNEHWVRIRTRLGGICGSDLALVALAASPSTSPFSSFPFVIGHENVGTIEACGTNVRRFSAGDRVTVNPLLCCEPRGISPPCAACAIGQHSRCEHFTDGALPAGMFIGFTRSLGGSWGERFVAHESQLVRVPDEMSDAAAVMTEPFACCVHAVLGARPEPGHRALVIGAGTMGLLMVAALKALVPDSPITVLARHSFQARHATNLGASRTVMARGDYLGDLADAAGTRLLKPILGRPIGVGGFDAVYVCISSARGVEDAMRFARAGATIVLLGNATTLKGLDWTPLWIKELTFRGTLAYGAHAHGGADVNAFNLAAKLIANGQAPVAGLVTHQFPLADYRVALQTARAKGAGESVKVAFRF